MSSISNISHNTTTPKPESCSRELTRRVRSFLNSDVFPLIPVEASQLPKTCQLNPLLDSYLEQEKNKIQVHQKLEWKCLYCNKVCSAAAL